MKPGILAHLEPSAVFHYFEDLTKIPRGSGNEAAVCSYLEEFAKARRLEYTRDASNNILMRRPAAPGFEDHPGVILQAHMDMVCEKNAGVEHDFTRDPIAVSIDGDRIIARDTTLGADDGIGVAMALAALADESLACPALEFVCTTDEERGMSGVEAFDASQLRGEILINLDSDDEGVFIIGCAGGPVVKVFLPLSREDVPAGLTPLRLRVRGLLGGHSGEDIHRCRANAIKLLCRLLYTLRETVDLTLLDLTGGMQYNAIPREAEALIAVPAGDAAKVRETVADYQAVFSREFRFSDPDIALTCRSGEPMARALTPAGRDALLNYLYFTQSGIVRQNPEFPDTVESSVSLGVVRLEDSRAVIHIMTRSSSRSMFEEMFAHIRRLSALYGASYDVLSSCPEWEYDPDSAVKRLCGQIYREMFGADPRYMILHAGVECGVLGGRAPRKLDMISMGPDVRNLHAPGEYFTISSTQKLWRFLRELLHRL